jgi:hypothetical protein
MLCKAVYVNFSPTDSLTPPLANGHPHDLTRISGLVAVDRRLLTAEIVCIAPFYDGLPFEVYGWKHRKATFLANFLSNWRGVR